MNEAKVELKRLTLTKVVPSLEFVIADDIVILRQFATDTDFSRDFSLSMDEAVAFANFILGNPKEAA